LIAMIELVFVSFLGYFFVVDNEKAEDAMATHVHYLQSIDNIEHTIHADMDIDESMGAALQVLLDDFQASRAWLLYPCDPDADFWSVPFERAVTAYPGAFEAGGEYPVDKDTRQVFTDALAAKAPVCYGRDRPIPGNQEVLKAFSIQSQIVVVLYPDSDQPWLLGLHQCDEQRQYTTDEQRLFQDIARRIEDALNQKLLYRDLKEVSIQAEAANAAKSEFLSVMSHELRTPLHGIIGLQDLIAADQSRLSEEQQEHLVLAQQAAKSLQALVNDILSLSKVEAGNVELAHEKFALKNCLLDSIAPFVIACRDKKLPLMVDVEDVSAYMVGDEVRLRQVLINLIGNAVKFTEQGCIEVHIKEQQGLLLFRIQDTGIGIQHEMLADIFQPFLQVKALMHKQHQGTGLGTTIAKRFVELMGGQIMVSSVFGEGSCFAFQIPCETYGKHRLTWQADVSQEALSAQRVHQENAVALEMPMLQMHVLLAEDDPIAQRIAEKRFKRANIYLDIAEDGLQAWDKLQHNDYDVLLTDIRMPRLDGIALTQRIRQREKMLGLPELPIIGLSAHALEEVQDRCYDVGMNIFMTKPIDPDTVLQQVQSIVQQRKS